MKKQKWIRKGLAMLLTIAMVVGMMPGAGTIKVSAAESEASVASTISYLDESGNIKTCESATLVTSEDTAWGTSGNDTWYVVNGDVTIGSADTVQRVTVNGNVHLILTDGCNLIVNGGIGVGLDSSLTIYGQTAGTGALEARNVGERNAGIGGGYGGNFSGGAITINGGTITATGGYAGAGIGGGGVSASGYLYDKGGPIIINGGTINANGGLNGAGIGDGRKGAGGRTITINGGTINAIGTDYAAGIGSGESGSSGGRDNGSIIINISGGFITATGGWKGAGVGGGSSDQGGVTINISGGTINATGGPNNDNGTEYAAGIGKGYNSKKTISVSITNSVVMASSISDTSSQDIWSGLIFNGEAGKLYGDSFNISTDCTIPSGKTLEVAAGQTVSIDDVTNFVNNGVICNSGTITGTVTNNGTIHNTGTISGAPGGTINHYSIEPIEINVCKLAVLTLKVNNTNTFGETVTYALSAEESNAIIENGTTLKVTNQNVIGSAIPVTATFTINGVAMTRTENVIITGHNYGTDGFCTICNGYQPATLTIDKHDINDDGTKDEVYEIINAGQLYWFADKVNSENSTYGSANVILMDYITVNENVLVNGDLNTDLTNPRSWTPIGNNSSAYIGTFKGNHKTISGLYLSDISTNYIGLFGYVGNDGKICDVGVVDSYFNGKYAVSGVCSYNYGIITNCYNTSRIICNQYEDGGVCASNFGVIENCYNEGEISGIGGNESSFGGVCANNRGIIRKSYNTGRVSGTGHIFGGVCGNNYGLTNSTLIENCYNTGEVSGTAAVSEYANGEIAIGGVCGTNIAELYSALIKNCYNIGNISGTASNAGTVMKGSVCGSSFKGTINNCYFLTGTGNVALGGNSDSAVEVVLEKDENQFASGEVAWLLNGKKSEDTEANPLVWYQNINEETADASPTFDTSHEIVYASEPCPIEYTNTSAKKKEHTYFLNTEDKTKHICTKCAYSAAHSTEKLSYEADDVNDTIAVTCGECNVALGTVILKAPEAGSLTYNGSEKTATVSDLVQCTGFTAPSITYKKGDTPLDSAPKDAGEYTASITLGEGDCAKTVSVTYEITKAAAGVGTAPSAKPDLTYNGNAQVLVTEGSATAGTGKLQYSTSQNGTYSADIPKGTDAGEYSVWYKVVGDDNHSDTTPVEIKVTIAPLTITNENTTINLGTPLTYTGAEQTQSIASVTVGTVALGAGDYTVSGNKGTNAGEYTLTVTGTGNFTGTATKEFSISKKSLTGTNQTLLVKKNQAKVVTYDLSKLLPEGVTGTTTYEVGTGTTDNGVLSPAPTAGDITDGKLTLHIASVESEDQTATVQITFTNSNYDISTATLTVKTTDKTPVTLSGVTCDNRTYNGTAYDYTGTPVWKTAENVTVTGDTTVVYYEAQNINENVIAYIPLEAAPTNAGSYKAVFTITSDAYVGSESYSFEITKAVITVAAKNKNIYVGDTVPSLEKPAAGTDYTVTGLCGTDTLGGTAAMSYAQKPDNTKTGTYAIEISGLTVPEGDNYTITFTNGTLTITTKPSGGGGSSSGGSTGGGSSSGGSSSGGSTGGDSSSGGSTGEVTTGKDSGSNDTTTTSPTEVKVENGTASATVKAENVTEAIKQAADHKSAEIVFTVSEKDTGNADKIQLTMTTSDVKQILDKSDADLVVATTAGDVILPQEALKEAVSVAGGNDITIGIDKVTTPTAAQKEAAGENSYIVEVTIASQNKAITTFGGNTLKVRLEIPAALAGKDVAVIHIAEDGRTEKMPGKTVTEGRKQYYEFTTPHLSTFALVDSSVIKEETPAVTATKKGTLLTDSKTKMIYKVTKSGTTGGTVQFVKTKNTKAKTIAIPDKVTIDGITYKVTSIAADALKNNKTVTTVTIGKYVTSIGSNAFSGCSRLKKVTIGKSVTTIGSRAFYKCTSLTGITIPSKVTKIGNYAFKGCTKLKTINLNTTLLTTKTVSEYAFSGVSASAVVKAPKSRNKTYKKLLVRKGLSKKVTVKGL